MFSFSIVVMVCVVSALSAGVTLVELQFFVSALSAGVTLVESFAVIQFSESYCG